MYGGGTAISRAIGTGGFDLVVVATETRYVPMRLMVLPSIRTALDLKGEYLFRRRFAAFFNLQNATNEPNFISEIAGPSTPAYARTTRKFEFPALWTFGIRAKY